jgi:alkylation response protein AidB-like acyl-CoA dehydrogenase
VDLLPGADERQIIDTLSGYLGDHIELGDGTAPVVPDATTWSGLAELGVFSLGIAEEHGGAGYGVAEELLAFREIGRHLVPGPVLATVLAAHLAAAAGRSELVAELAEGTRRATLAEPFRDPDATLSPAPRGRFVLADVASAEYVLAVVGDTFALLRTVDLPAPEPLKGLDPDSRPGTVVLDGGEPLLTAEDPALRLRGMLLTAATLCGVAEAARDRSADYVKNRTQFGQPIGSFQAVKHRCAEMATRSEAATAQTIYAGLVLAEGRSDAAFQVAAAKLVATATAIDNAADNVQNFGGMGFTDESGAHRYVRRARLLDQQLGGRPQQASALLAQSAPQ